MSKHSQEQLEEEFSQFLTGHINKIREEGYDPLLVPTSIESKGARHTCKELINAKEIGSGFKRLCDKGRIGLTFESQIVNNKKWHSLFTEEEIKICEERIENYKLVSVWAKRGKENLARAHKLLVDGELKLAGMVAGVELEYLLREWCEKQIQGDRKQRGIRGYAEDFKNVIKLDFYGGLHRCADIRNDCAHDSTKDVTKQDIQFLVETLERIDDNLPKISKQRR